MILYHTKHSTYEVNPSGQLIRRLSNEGPYTWFDNRWVPYEFIERLPEGELYVHAFDPDTNTLRPFKTTAVMAVEEL